MKNSCPSQSSATYRQKIAIRSQSSLSDIYAIGDIHGRADLLEALLGHIAAIQRAGSSQPVIMEEALGYGGLGAVVGELVRLPMTKSRRLQLAAEKSGTMGLIVRRWRRQTEARDFGQPTASATRWRVSVTPSEELPVQGVGRAQWRLELIRVKAGECAEYFVGACDAKGRINLSSGAGDGQDQAIRSFYSR